MTEEEKNMAVRRNLIPVLVLLVFAILIGLRIMNILSQSPEYDEIWTVRHYVNIPVGRILSDVATPNNHVLNSLGIKFFSAWVPNPFFAMRLPALLGFAGLFFLLLRGGVKLFRKKAACGCVMAAVLLDGMILHYAETARGYSLQIFFVFGLMLSLLCFSSDTEKKNHWFNAAMWLICAFGSCLSVSSGVIFVSILTGLWGLLHVPFLEGLAKLWKDYRPLLLAGLLWLLFVLIWYGGNYTRFAEGRANFGESFTSAGQYFRYCGDLLWSTGLLWPLLLSAAGIVWLRRGMAVRIMLLSGGTVLLVMISAIFTKGGPTRVYLPLVPVAVFGAGAMLDEILIRHEKLKKWGLIFFLAAAAASAYFSESRRIAAADPDLGMIFPEVKKIDSSVLTVYRPTDLYVILNLFGKNASEDHAGRLQNPSMLMLLHDNQIGTMRFSDSATGSVPTGCSALDSGFIDPARKMPFWLYRLRPVRTGENLSGKAVLCIVHGVIPELQTANHENWLKNSFAVVNGFLTARAVRFCFAADGSKLKADDLLHLEHSRSGRVFFRVVTR